MTTHETALARSLAGGPIAVEDAEHLRDCPACRQELAALRALETSLRLARPDGVSVSRVPLRETGRPRRFRRALVGAAAAVLFSGTLGVAWLGGRGTERPAAPEASQEVSLPSGEEDSTFALLLYADRTAQESPSSEELSDYLETHWGG